MDTDLTKRRGLLTTGLTEFQHAALVYRLAVLIHTMTTTFQVQLPGLDLSEFLAQTSISQQSLGVDLLTSQMSCLAGIGKSLFSFYFMRQLAKEGGQTIVWEQKDADDGRVQISDKGVFCGLKESFKEVLRQKNTWYA